MSIPERRHLSTSRQPSQWAWETSRRHAEQWHRERIGYLVTTPRDVKLKIEFFEALGMYDEAGNVADENAELIAEWENWQ